MLLSITATAEKPEVHAAPMSALVDFLTFASTSC